MKNNKAMESSRLHHDEHLMSSKEDPQPFVLSCANTFWMDFIIIIIIIRTKSRVVNHLAMGTGKVWNSDRNLKCRRENRPNNTHLVLVLPGPCGNNCPLITAATGGRCMSQRGLKVTCQIGPPVL